jgi:hypothetical protein
MKGDASTFSLTRQAEDREGEVFSFYGVHEDRSGRPVHRSGQFCQHVLSAFSGNQQRVHCG